MNRREFLKRAGVALAGLSFPQVTVPLPFDQPPSPSPPGSFARVATWWTQTVRRWPTARSERVALKYRDEVFPIHAVVIGEPPWPGNPYWYQIDGGFIHSGYLHPSEDHPSDEVIPRVQEPGFWAEVCVPIAEARWQPGGERLYRKLYYGTVYRVVEAVADDEGEWWYRLKEGITWSPGPYVPTWAVRRIPPEDLTPISPDRSDKWIEISLVDQKLKCFEGNRAVFQAPISSGLTGATPRGEHRVLRKRHTSRMTGGEGDDYYDLPGVAFPVYFTGSGVASHGTYWHNDFVRPHSHGCVNMTNRDARWVFRWSEPMIPYEEFSLVARAEEATRVVVV